MDREDVIHNLMLLQIGSCACCTKSPQHEWHKENCEYRILVEIGEWVKNLPQSVVKCNFNNKEGEVDGS